MSQQTLSKWRGIAAVGIAIFSLAAVARADVKVVSEVTVKGRPEAVKGTVPEKSTSVSYYKGDKQRIETEKPVSGKGSESEKTIVISDLANGKTYTLDPSKKTYTVFSLADIDKMAAENPVMQMLKVETQTTVTPGTGTKSIAGKNSRQYLYNTNFKISLEGGDEQLAAIADMMPTITIKGEQWTSEEVNFPIDYQKVAQSNLTRAVPAMMAKGMKEMFDKFGAIKGFPLSSVVTVTFTLPKNAAPQMVASLPKEPIITTTEVKSISEENLDDSLFTVPVDFKEVKAPTPGVAGTAPAPPSN